MSDDQKKPPRRPLHIREVIITIIVNNISTTRGALATPLRIAEKCPQNVVQGLCKVRQGNLQGAAKAASVSVYAVITLTRFTNKLLDISFQALSHQLFDYT